MVTIVNPGPDPSVVKRHICTNCGAVLEYVPRDIKSQTTGDYGGGSDTWHYIICPQCRDNQTIKRY